MRNLLLTFIAGFSLLLTSCSNDDESNPTNPFGGGATTGGGVTFTIGQRAGDQGGIMFTVNPSTAITVATVTIKLPAQNFEDTIQDDGTTVYAGNQVYDMAEYSGVASGQQWTFQFKGKVGSAQGEDYDVTSNYTVP